MKSPIFLRQVKGWSMKPTLKPDKLVAVSRRLKLKTGVIVVAKVDGRDVVKRIAKLKHDKVFLVGDNLINSHDSRNYGWLNQDKIIGRVIWPRLPLRV
jgi:phage repressor protein C with HTH and peptisase S24 domain